MVTWSVTSTSVPPSEYFVSGTSPSVEAASYAALSFVGSLMFEVPGDTPYCVVIGMQDFYKVTVEQAFFAVIAPLAHLLDVAEV